MAAAWHGNPDVAWQLRGQLVKLQRREQAEHGLRSLGGHGAQAVELRWLCAWQAVQAPPHPFQQASSGESREDDAGRVDGIQIAGANQPLLAGQAKNALGVGIGVHGQILFQYFVG